MKTYRAYLAEIQRLQAKADAARRRELKGVVAHIRELIVKHELTREDLGLIGDVPRARRAKAAHKTVGVARYRDPASGKTWTGRGKPPAWIAGAKDRSAFEIGAAVPAAQAKALSGKVAKKGAKKAAVRGAPAKRPKAAKQGAGKKSAAKKLAARKPAAGKAAAKGPVAKKPPVKRAKARSAAPEPAPAPPPAPTDAAA